MNVDLLQDGISSLLWLMIWVGLAWSFQKRKKLVGKEQQLFWLALMLKVIAGLAFGFYFMVIQRRGDAFEYFHCLQLLWHKVEGDPVSYVRFLAAPPGDPSFPYHIYFTQSSPLAMIKVGLVISLLTFNSFWGMSICLSGLIFFASWHIFKGWKPSFDTQSWWGAFCLFFLPSVLFWGSGWGKDGIIWLALCMVLGGGLRLRNHRSFQPKTLQQIGLIGLGSFLIGYLKTPLIGIILMALLAGILISKIHSVKLQVRTGLYIGFGAFLLVVLFWQQRFFVELLSYQQWHTDAFDAGQSAYELPEIRRIREFLLYLPYLAFGGLFRPLPWEWGHPLVTLGGIEVIIVWLAFAYWIRQQRVRFLIKSLLKSPVSISLLVFALCLSIASMLFSQNFGTLLRYRMPALVLFLLSFWQIQENSRNI